MKEYQITEQALNAIIDMYYHWCNLAIVDINKLTISSPDGNIKYDTLSDMIIDICDNTSITLDTLIG